MPPLINPLSITEQAVLNDYCLCKDFPVGHGLMRQGDTGDGCYLLDEGRVRVELVGGTDSRAIILGYIESGGLVGEMSLAGMPTRSASVFTETAVSARWLSKDRYAELERDAPEVAMAFSRIIAQDMARKVESTTARLLGYVSTETTAAEAEALVERAVARESPFASPLADKFLSTSRRKLRSSIHFWLPA